MATSVSISYLGPPGTFTHAALTRAIEKPSEIEVPQSHGIEQRQESHHTALIHSLCSSPRVKDTSHNGSNVGTKPPLNALDLHPHSTIEGTIAALLSGEVSFAFVPLDNSLVGPVSETTIALKATNSLVRIAGTINQPIHQCLIAREKIELKTITEVLSHPHALAQCARFLNQQLPHAEQIPTSSTVAAVKAVREFDIRDSLHKIAAIGSAFAASLYSGVVLATDIEDQVANCTQFGFLVQDEA